MKLRTPNSIYYVTAVLRDNTGKPVSREVVTVKDYTGKPPKR